MTEKEHRSRNIKGLGIPNLRSRQNAANYFSEKNFFGEAGKQMRSVFAVKVADFAQYWSGAEILFCSVALRLTKQVLGKRYPFRQKWVPQTAKSGLPQKNALG